TSFPGLPDPPVDVQVEPGPQDQTLLVTWLPVTINNSGTSNGAPVLGYAVYADGKKVTDVDSPTADHALLDLTHLGGFTPRTITVRTKSRDGQSADSMPGIVRNNMDPEQQQRMTQHNTIGPKPVLSDIEEEEEASGVPAAASHGAPKRSAASQQSSDPLMDEIQETCRRAASVGDMAPSASLPHRPPRKYPSTSALSRRNTHRGESYSDEYFSDKEFYGHDQHTAPIPQIGEFLR
ncbi:unnamed protein product, partial [Cyprideis torosa]